MHLLSIDSSMDSISGSENKSRKNMSDHCTSRIVNLPREVALDLLSRLPITSLMRFRFASMSCQNLSFDPHLINLHHSRIVKNTTCLIFQSGYPFQSQLHFVEFSDYTDKEVVRKIQPPFPNLTREFKVFGSSNGLICSSNSKNHDVIHIFNPFTRKYRLLPESTQFDHQKVLVGFGFHPLTNEYKVIKIVYYLGVNDPYLPRNGCRLHIPRLLSSSSIAYTQSQVQVYSVGSNKWRSIGKMPCEVKRWASEPLLVNGRLHWLTQIGYGGGYAQRIVCFDLADEQFKEVPTPNWGGMRRDPYPLMALGGCLSMVVYPRDKDLEIWVMKEYGIVESWSKHTEIDVNDANPVCPNFWSTAIQSLAVRVLCLTKDGGVLLMNDGALALYDPESRELKNVMFEGMPNSHQAIIHEGSLVWIEDV